MMVKVRQLGEWFAVCGAATIVSMTAIACSSEDSGTTTGAQTSQSLYERLGKRDGIRTAVSMIVGKELQDPSIAKFFASNAPAKPGHPSAEQIIECFTLQLGNAAGGPEQYPSMPADSKGFQCRPMAAAHAGLGISDAEFDKFLMIAGSELKELGVADADITTIAMVLTSQKSGVVGK